MHTESLSRLRVHLEGRVQGVGFRFFVQHTASALGLTGWVRNRWDGSVEVLAEGPRPSLDRLLAALRQGPRGAMVTDCQVSWEEGSGEFAYFSVRRTA